jgi:hypothetical protein
MAVILAFDIVARFNCAGFPMGKQGASAGSAKAALGRFASTEVAFAAVYH